LTARSAERITGFSVRQVPYGGGKSTKAYALYIPDSDIELCVFHVQPPSEAISRLVEFNYNRVRRIVFTEQRWRCFHCWRLNVGLESDHIKPRSKGRDDSRLNLRGLCSRDHARVTAGEKLDPHPRMVELMSKVGLRWIGNWESRLTPCGWERFE
jgi:HNH endonuclease